GEVWSLEAINEVKQYIDNAGLHWSVVESLPVAESIKYGGRDRDLLIDNYKTSLANLGKAGIKTVCYNFMPVIDWIRTDLEYLRDDGTYTLYFDKIRFAFFDCCILKREGAWDDYSLDEIAQVKSLKDHITEAEKEALIDVIIVKTQGFINGNVKAGDPTPLESFTSLLALYKGFDKDRLRRNMQYFLEQIMPVCDEYDINMCVHPDDPPCRMLGLPRIVTCEEDIRWILQSVDNPHNGLTFCAGSLSAGLQNDVPDLARHFASRTHFVHLRSTDVFPNGDFIEAGHLEGRGRLIETVRIFEALNPSLPMRVDHGRLMSGDRDKAYNPGYSFLGRMYALAQIDGVIATVKNELHNNKQT
ncbi:MAG: mannonate dehydratase, partial [Tannerella sp.]|nr:mannonate dehydratase [Tannerella sp.]